MGEKKRVSNAAGKKKANQKLLSLARRKKRKINLNSRSRSLQTD